MKSNHTYDGEFDLQTNVFSFHSRERTSNAGSATERLRAFDAMNGATQGARNAGTARAHKQPIHVVPNEIIKKSLRC